MRGLTSRILVSAAGIFLAGSADATTTLTTPTFTAPTGAGVACSAVNTVRKPISMTIDVLTYNGFVLASSGVITVAPSQTG